MPRMKMLKSIAHNVAHSYLSLMNYIDGEYTVERLYQIAKESNQTNIVIDILRRSIEPAIYVIPEIEKSLLYLEKTQISKTVPELELPKYECMSEIIDSTGKVYRKEVVEWWKY
ncbi:MAG: hypothetical protein ACI8WT_003569 [Clostridium sp.]|jgi:hypothetical protein